MHWIFKRTVALLSSLGLSCTLLMFLALLTWLGTLEQQRSGLFEVQRKYFESFFLIHDAVVYGRHIPIPLPGATLVLGVLFFNLLVGGIVRLRRSASTIGVLITHVGIMLLIIAGLVKMQFSDDGHVTLYEGQQANTFQSYHHWEVAVTERLDGGRVRESVAEDHTFTHATGATPVKITSANWPFDLELRSFQPNARVFPKGPMMQAVLPVVDGYVLVPEAPEKENEANVAGIYATILDKQSGARKEAILWGFARAPLTIESGGRTFGIDLRRQQFVMPFTIRLDDFKKEDHPRMSMAKAFSSDVTVFEGESSRNVRIEMNEQLRSEGLVIYQASWGPSNARPGDPLFSTLSVVRNPADQHPLIACIIIAIGMLLHFGRKLARHIRVEAQKS